MYLTTEETYFFFLAATFFLAGAFLAAGFFAVFFLAAFFAMRLLRLRALVDVTHHDQGVSCASYIWVTQQSVRFAQHKC